MTRTTIQDGIPAVAHEYGITAADITGPRRDRKYSRPRQLAYVLSQSLGHSLPVVGEAFGARDHTTVLHGIGVALEHCQRDAEAFNILEKLTRGLIDLPVFTRPKFKTVRAA